MILEIPTVPIPEGCGLRREPPRPSEDRQPNYEKLFDFHTLLYDAVYLSDRKQIVLLCPPALNLKQAWREARFSSLKSPESFYQFKLEELDRLLRVTVNDVESIEEGIKLEFGGRAITLPIITDQSHHFAGRKVLFTVSRDNPLTWIVDWAEYYAKVHGIDAVLIFDNQSTAYSSRDLHATLSSLPGLATVHVVDWPALWGPVAGPNKIWDSNFGQHGALEVARWRFLQHARLVMNADIDELLLPKAEVGLDAKCNASTHGALLFASLWAVGVNGAPVQADDPRHRNFGHVVRSSNPLAATKWAISPLSAEVKQWKTHSLRGIRSQDILTPEFEIRHFREIGLSWKFDRSQRHEQDDPRIYHDEQLVRVFQRIGWR